MNMKNKNEMVKNQKPENETFLPDSLLVKKFLEIRLNIINQMKPISEKGSYYYSENLEYLIFFSNGNVDSELSEVNKNQVEKAVLLVQRMEGENKIVLGSYIAVCQNLFGKVDFDIDDLNNLIIT